MIKIQQTVIIGLGSQGRATLEYLKKRIIGTYGVLPAIKLLALDFPRNLDSQAGAQSDSILGPTEYIELSLDEIKQNPRQAQKSFPWVQDRVVTYGDKWTQTRTAGRLSFHIHANAIIKFLEYNLHQLGTVESRDEMLSKGFEIASEQNEASLILVAGLGDILGSSLLFDTEYLIDRLYNRAGLQVFSSAILFMPPLTPSDPLSEARAYASLKELCSFLNGHSYKCDYPGIAVNSDLPPFDRGCYLVDTRNEKNITLHSQEEVFQLTAEWLFRTVLSPLKSRMDEYLSDQRMIHPTGPNNLFSSFGLSTYIIPIEDLIEWSSLRLSNNLVQDHLLMSESFSKVSARIADFLTNTHLRPDDLINVNLRSGKDGKPIKLQHEVIARLNKIPYDQITPQVQATVDDIGKKILPSLKQQIETNAKQVLQDVDAIVKREIATILRQWPTGGLSLASQFTSRLYDDAQRFSESLSRKEATFQGRNHQQLNHLYQLGPLLRNTVSGIPNKTIIVVSILCGFIAPLFLISSWAWAALNSTSQAAAVASIPLLFIFSIGGILFSIWRTKNGIDEIRDQYVVNLNKRFEAELSLALVQAARSLYPDVMSVAKIEKERLDNYALGLQGVAREYRKNNDEKILCGEINFALQRSVLTDDIVEELYERYLGPGRNESRLASFLTERGDLAKWLNRPLSELKEELQEFSGQVFKEMYELHVEDILNRHVTSQIVGEKLVRELEEKASPLWIYDQFSLGQVLNPSSQTFIGMDSSASTEFHQLFTRVNQSMVFKSINDPYSLIMTTIRCGMPLFGLRRMHELRKQYLDTTQNLGEPLHLESELALLPDIMPLENQESRIDAATAFKCGSGIWTYQTAGRQSLCHSKFLWKEKCRTDQRSN